MKLTGCLIKRHKIPLPGNNSEYYQILDLNVGVTVEFYGKRFKIIGVDNFTRDFLGKYGVDVPENLSMPTDPYFLNREKVIRPRPFDSNDSYFNGLLIIKCIIILFLCNKYVV